MNTVQRIAKNIVALITARIVSAVSGFFFVMYVARYLGVEGFGVLSFALAFTAIFAVFTEFGLYTLTIREVAKDKTLAPKYVGNITTLKTILVVIFFGLVALTINLLGYPEQTVNIIYLLALSVICNAFSTMFYSIFQAHEKMELVTIGQVINSLLQLAGALFAISQGLGVTAFAYVYLVASGATLSYSSIVSTWKFTRPRIEADFGFCKGLLKQAWPLALVAILGTLYYYADTVILSIIKGDEVVGWYNAAYRLIMLFLFIPSVYYESVFPVMSRFLISSIGSLKTVYEKSIKYLLTLAVPIGVGTTLLADKIMLQIFGAEYYNSIITLRVLVWAVVFTFVSGVIAQLFYSLNRQIDVAKVTGVAALLDLILNLIFIPRYSLFLNIAEVGT